MKARLRPKYLTTWDVYPVGAVSGPVSELTKWRHRARVVEAMALITAATTVRRLLPMPRWSRLLGESKTVRAVFDTPGDASRFPFAQSPGDRTIARAIRSAGSRMPYDPRCLDRATAGQLMLRRRRRSGVVVIGLAPGGHSDEKWGAHAWLVGASGVLTGGAEARSFTAASCFVPPDVRTPLPTPPARIGES